MAKASSKKRPARKPAKKAAKKKAKKKAPKKAKKPDTAEAAAKTGGIQRGAKGAPPAGTKQLPFEGADTQTDMLYPAGTIARMLTITTRRLRQLAAEGIVPKATRGRYPLEGSVSGYVGYLQKLRETGEEHAKESTRLTRVRADDKELEVELKLGKVYKREVVDEALYRAATGLTAELDGCASRIASQLGGGAALRKRLVGEFREIRDNFAAGLREFSGRLREDGWDRRPATRSRARRVGTRKPSAASRKS